jgi:hypothetical protein
VNIRGASSVLVDAKEPDAGSDAVRERAASAMRMFCSRILGDF